MESHIQAAQTAGLAMRGELPESFEGQWDLIACILQIWRKKKKNGKAQIKKRQEMFSKDIDKAKEQIITEMKSKLEGMIARRKQK